MPTPLARLPDGIVSRGKPTRCGFARRKPCTNGVADSRYHAARGCPACSGGFGYWILKATSGSGCPACSGCFLNLGLRKSEVSGCPACSGGFGGNEQAVAVAPCVTEVSKAGVEIGNSGGVAPCVTEVSEVSEVSSFHHDVLIFHFSLKEVPTNDNHD